MTGAPGARARAALLRGITRNVVALGVVSLLTDISSELLIYVVPLFLANVLAATPTIIGIVEGVAESVAAFVKLGSGALSDRIGRRTVLVGAGYSASVAAKALYVVATAWPVVLVARVGDRIGKGIRTAPRDALIADSTAPESRGRAFGLHRAMDTTGAVIGVALAALIVGAVQGDDTTLQGDTFRLLALAALIPGVLALVAIAVGVRDVPRPVPVPVPGAEPVPVPVAEPVPAPTPARELAAEPPPGPVAAPASTAGLWRGFPAAFWIFVAASGLFTLGNSSDAFIALRSQALGVSVRDLLVIVIAFNIVDALVAWPVGALSDRIGRRRLIAIAWSLYAITYAGLALAGSPSAVLPLWLLYGAYYGVNEAVGRALVADLARPELRATAYGILNAVTGLAILPASIVAGLLWDRLGQPAPFWFGAACAAGGLALLAFVRPPRR
ncbi:MAG: MFS transporter [Chloroflexi bacterium]|nr:MFS transporter [Chloroflexota bacterium]